MQKRCERETRFRCFECVHIFRVDTIKFLVMRAFYVLLFIVWISSTFCHIWSGKRSLSLSGVWIRGGASENLNSNSGNMIVLRLRSYDGAVSRLNVDASQSIQDLASEITKIISPNILSNAEVTIKGDPAQSLGGCCIVTILVTHELDRFSVVSYRYGH